ncbi:MAG: hypothetical protein ACM3XZ_10620 [Betaproteobacteria bacterium]
MKNERQDPAQTSYRSKGTLTKERITKPDGRYLIFYRFRRPGDSPGRPAGLPEGRARLV